MMISAWWLIAVLVVGAYAGITLMAMLVVSSRPTPQPDDVGYGNESAMSTIAAALRSDEDVARPVRERRARKRTAPKLQTPDPLEQQATLQW